MTPKEHRGLQKSFEQIERYLDTVLEFPYVKNNYSLKDRAGRIKNETYFCLKIITSDTFKNQITNENNNYQITDERT